MVKIDCSCRFGVRGCSKCSGKGYIEVPPEQYISQQEFMKYEELRISGQINMNDHAQVSMITGLPRVKLSAIRANYDTLSKCYLIGKE